MNNYYQILGVNKNATNQDIELHYVLLKENNKIDEKKAEAYAILSDYHKRRKYDELLEKKNRFSLFKIPFFGYDFDEDYIYKYSKVDCKNKLINLEESKKFKIDENKYLILEKKKVDGVFVKNYYIETNEKRELISDETINKIKQLHYKKLSFSLLKDKQLN